MRIAIVALMIALQSFGAMATIAMVGRPRKPLTGGVAAGSTVVAAAFVAGIPYLA